MMAIKQVGKRWQEAIENDNIPVLNELLGVPLILAQCVKRYRIDGTWFLFDSLCECVRRNNFEMVLKMLEAGRNPNITYGLRQNNVPEEKAFCLGWTQSPAVRQLLLEYGANPASFGKSELPFKRERTVPPSQVSNNLGERWSDALKQQNKDRIGELLQSYPHLANQMMLDHSGNGRFWSIDPLYQMAQFGKMEIVESIVEAGCPVRRICSSIEMATPEIASYLLKYCPNGQPDLPMLAYFGRARELQFWIDKGMDVSKGLLHDAACGRGRHRGYESDEHTGWPGAFRKTVKVLIKGGADVNERNPSGNKEYSGCKPWVTNGETPLHYAAASWDPEVVRQLLEYGADIKALNDLGESPLDWAIKWDAPEELLELLQFPQ